MTINVLYLTPWFPVSTQDPRGGFILDSISAQEEMGVNAHIVRTISWKPSALAPHYERANILTLRYLSIPRHYGRAISNWSYIVRLKRTIMHLVKKHNIHLINAHTELAGMVAVRAGKSLNIPVLVTVHGIDTCPRVWAGSAGRMIDNTLKQADRVIVVGEPLIDFFQQRLDNLEHFRVVHNGVRLYPDMIDFKKQAWSNHINIISVSNLQEGKGVDITIRALAKLKQAGIVNWTYTVVGDGADRRTLEQLVNQLSLTPWIHFAGLCSHDTVCQKLKSADVFCLPSYREAFGIAYLEAMAHGLLAIGVYGEGPQAFIKHQETGLLVKPRDPDELMQIFQQIVLQPERMQNIARCGRKHVLERFTWKKHADTLMKVYQDVLS